MGISQSKNKGGSTAVSIRGSKSSTHAEFHQFSMFSDDIALEIISYLAEAPFEVTDQVQSPLTHTLPYVNLQFRDICKSDMLWIASLRRLAIRDPDRCKNAFKQLLKAGKTAPKWSFFYNTNVDKDDFMLAAKVDNMDCFDKREMFSLVSNIYDSVAESRSFKHIDGSSSTNEASTSDCRTESKSSINTGNSSDNGTIDSAQSLYFSVVKDFCYLALPIFHMRCSSLHPGVQMSLTLFEPRYQMLVREAMAGRKASELRGKLLKEPRPRFIFCHKRTMVDGSTVFMVEITRCRMMEAGRAQIMINPIKKVKMLKAGLRPGVSNHLMDAQIRRFE